MDKEIEALATKARNAATSLEALQYSQAAANVANAHASVIANSGPRATVKQMVARFLQWKLPANFAPDGGITFKRTYNEHTPHPAVHAPVGTNLFDATQAEAMVRYMLEAAP